MAERELAMPGSQVRGWIGTLFVEENADIAQWMENLQKEGVVEFICGQKERCPTTERLHLQFIVQFARSTTLGGVRKRVHAQAHWEPVYGSMAQAKAYCTKEETRVDGPWEFGQMSMQGKRRGLDDAVEAVKGGMPLHEVAAEYSLAWVSHGRGLTSLRQQLGLESDRRRFGPDGPEVWVLWGPTGTGKSRFAAERWPDAFWKAPDDKWWDGYRGQETVVIDDFKDYGMRLIDMQRLLDRYPLWVEVKGGSIPMLATRYVLTSNTPPCEWYVKADPGRTLERRVNEYAARFGRLIHCVEGWEPPGDSVAEVAVAEVPGNTRQELQPPSVDDPLSWRPYDF